MLIAQQRRVTATLALVCLGQVKRSLLTKDNNNMRRNAWHCFFHKIERRGFYWPVVLEKTTLLVILFLNAPIVVRVKSGLSISMRTNRLGNSLALRFFLAILSIFFFTPAFSASFDCGNYFWLHREVSICENSELSALDDQLAIAYRSAVAAAPDKKLDCRESHLVWISEIRNECEDATCL